MTNEPQHLRSRRDSLRSSFDEGMGSLSMQVVRSITRATRFDRSSSAVNGMRKQSLRKQRGELTMLCSQSANTRRVRVRMLNPVHSSRRGGGAFLDEKHG